LVSAFVREREDRSGQIYLFGRTNSAIAFVHEREDQEAAIHGRTLQKGRKSSWRK
jgi:hypothetical protein